MEAAERTRTTLYISVPLLVRAKKVAADAGRPLSQVIDFAIERSVTEMERSESLRSRIPADGRIASSRAREARKKADKS